VLAWAAPRAELAGRPLPAELQELLVARAVAQLSLPEVEAVA